MKEISSLIKNYKFLSLWISQILSQLTINILSFVILIHLFDQTGSTIATSILLIVYAMPAIIVGPIAAAWVDLQEKRKILMTTNLFQSIVVVIYAIFLYKKLLYLSYAVVFVYSFLNQFYVPAEAATLPTIVPKEKLTAANGLFFITQQSSLVIGFGTAGILDEIFGFRPTLILAAMCLFIAFLSVSFLPRMKVEFKLPQNFEKRFSIFFEQIIEGYYFIKNTRKILFPFLLLLGAQVIFAVITVNLPRLSTDILNISTRSSGFIVVVPAGIGAMMATLLISKLIREKIPKRNIVLSSLVILAVSMVSVGIIIPMISSNTAKTILAITFFVLTGFGAIGTLVPSITYLQQHTPKDLLGRVFGDFWFLTNLATVFPVLLSATITDLFGVQFLLISLGLTTLLLTIYSGVKVNEL